MNAADIWDIAGKLSRSRLRGKVEQLSRRAQTLLSTARGTADALLQNAIGPAECGLLILDDVFPSLLSGFRIAEYNEYLKLLPGTQVHTTSSGAARLGETRSFERLRQEYEREYPNLSGSTRRFNKLRRLKAAGAYLVFINNAQRFLPVLERDDVPLIFTLYPGGGFALNDPASDAKLERVFKSPCFEGVIVTQRITRDYLLKQGYCSPEKIHFVYGGVFPSEKLVAALPRRMKYGVDKRTFDICFVAHRYMKGGRDKGYDTFIATAQRLYDDYDDVHFHVVGPWTAEDADVSSLGGRIHFHGSQPTEFFASFYAAMDAILSPNVPFVLGSGFFDGFPTGACMEAGMCGVPVICSDELELNTELRDGEEVVIVKPTVTSCVAAVSKYREDPVAWAKLSEATSRAFRHIFGLHAQMTPRIRLIGQGFQLKTTSIGKGTD